MNAVATADVRAKTMPSTLTWSPATAPRRPRMTRAHTGAGRCHGGQTDPHRANLPSHHLPGGRLRTDTE